MGATGALIMALARRRLVVEAACSQAMDSTAKLTAFVVFILIGARVFSLTFYGVDGHIWVEHLLTEPAGRRAGLPDLRQHLRVLLAFFLDFFELVVHHRAAARPGRGQARHRPHLVRRAAGVNMQTSFMHPPFGFALFYLRSVAPAKEYLDKLTGKRWRRSRRRRSTGARCRA